MPSSPDLQVASGLIGWMSPGELEFLAKMASDADIIIEAGCFHGRSTRAMADNMKAGAKLYAVDPWGIDLYSDQNRLLYRTSNHDFNCFLFNLDRHINSGQVVPVPSKFELFTLDSVPDFIFLDGDHRYPAVVRDIKHALSFNPRILAGHDYISSWPGVEKAVNEIFNKDDINTLESIWWIQRY